MFTVEELAVLFTGDASSVLKASADSVEAFKRVEAEAAKASTAIETQSGRLTAFGASIQSVASGVLGALSTIGIVSWVSGARDAFEKADLGMKRLEVSIQSSGGAVASTVKDYKEFAASVAAVTTTTSLQTLTLLTQAHAYGLSGDAAKQAVKNSIALAAVSGGEAAGYIRVTAMLAQGHPELAKRALGLRGIKDESELTAKIQQRLTAGFALARVEGATVGAQMTRLWATFGGLRREIGEMVSSGMKPLIGVLQNAATWFQNLDPITRKSIVTVGGLAASFLALKPAIALLSPVITLAFAPLKVVGSALAAIPGWWSLIASSISGVAGLVSSVALTVLSLLNPVKLISLAFVGLKTVLFGIGTVLTTVFSPVTIGFAAVAVGVKLLIDHFGGLQATWDAVKEAGAEMWDFLILKAGEFKDFVMPIWDATKSLGVATWDAIKEGATLLWASLKGTFTTIGTFISGVWEAITGSAVLNWTAIRDAIRDAILFAEFTLKNFGQVAEFTWTGVKLGFVTFANQVQFFFTDILPAALTWFGENWKAVFLAAYNFTKDIFVTIGKNIKIAFDNVNWSGLWDKFKASLQVVVDKTVAVFKAIPKFVKGVATFAGIWKEDAGDAVDAALKEYERLPESVNEINKGIKPFIVPERQAGDLENRLREEFQAQGAALKMGFAEFKKLKLDQFAADGLIGPKAEQAKKNALGLGVGIGDALTKGVHQEVQKVDSVLFGSQEHIRRFQAYLDTFRTDLKISSTEGTGIAGAAAGAILPAGGGVGAGVTVPAGVQAGGITPVVAAGGGGTVPTVLEAKAMAGPQASPQLAKVIEYLASIAQSSAVTAMKPGIQINVADVEE